MDSISEKNKIFESENNQNTNKDIYKNIEIIEAKKDEIPEENIITEYVLKTNGTYEIFRYFKKRLLGKGGYGEVYEVICEWSKEKYACKIIPKKNKHKHFKLENIYNEINLHKSLCHPLILKFIHHFSDTNNIYILTELCKNQTLRTLLNKRGTLTELEIQYYSIQIICAMKYLNDHCILHRDLKLSNIFLSDNMKIKIGDFGLSIILKYELQNFEKICGTKYYIAPEMVSGGYKLKSDIWSFGVILYVLCTGHFPFTSKNIKKNVRSAERHYYRKPFKYRKVSPELCDLIDQIFVYGYCQEMFKRPDWIKILNHDFFKIGKSIPKTLPISTFDSRPSLKFIQEYMPNADETGYIKTKKTFKDIKKIRKNNKNENKERSLCEKIVNEINKKTFIKEINILDQDVEFWVKNHDLNQNFINGVDKNKGLKSAEIFVKEYVNEMMTFGLVYVLSNGDYGIYFKDNSRLIADSNFKHYYFLEEKGEKIIANHYKINDKVDKHIEKGVNLLKSYKDYFDKKTNKKFPPLEGLYADEFDDEELDKNIKICEDDIPIHIKYWLLENKSYAFGFTDGTFQTIFSDNTQIILSVKERSVTFFDLERKKWVYNASKAFVNNNNIDMQKRLVYVRNLINIFWNKVENNKFK